MVRGIIEETMKTPAEILKSVFGYDQFLFLQEEIINHVLARKDALVILPTGGGKSLCYQVPALIFKKMTIVVSPLISLMKDQVDQLNETGVPAIVLNSSLSPEQYRHHLSLIQNRQVKLLYIAPESLLRPNILEILSSAGVDCLAIDEAHCISAWGHDFRPEYRQMIDVRKKFADAVCIALTATATRRVREDIRQNLDFQGLTEFTGSYDRKNLMLRVVFKDNPLAQTLALLERYPEESGIIYCQSRKQVDSLSHELNTRGFNARPYHAGLPEAERTSNQQAFARDNIRIMVATIAFGMGIDKSNIRFVVHYDLPKDMESYYQEIGRAGRDSLESECLLLFSHADIYKIKSFFNQNHPSEAQNANIRLSAMVQYAEARTCRRKLLLGYFGENYPLEKCKNCDVCLACDENTIDLTVPAQKFLSCVKRTGERFGAGHIGDVLRGSQSRKILNFSHQELSTYGIGKEYSKKQWFYLSRQFLSQGILSQDMEFGGLQLTPDGWQVLRGEKTVRGWLDEDRKNPAAEGGQRKSHETDETVLSHDDELFEILRKKRKHLADASGVPPFVIFSDKSLMEMAAFFPRSQAAFLEISGVGKAKMERYSSEFVPVIQTYCAEKQIPENPRIKSSAVETSKSGKKRFLAVGEMYNSGMSVSNIAAHFSSTPKTVIDNLYRFFQEGYAIESGHIIELSDVSRELQDKTMELFDRCGHVFLKPVFDDLNGEIDYDALKILRLYYLYKRKSLHAEKDKSHIS